MIAFSDNGLQVRGRISSSACSALSQLPKRPVEKPNLRLEPWAKTDFVFLWRLVSKSELIAETFGVQTIR